MVRSNNITIKENDDGTAVVKWRCNGCSKRKRMKIRERSKKTGGTLTCRCGESIRHPAVR